MGEVLGINPRWTITLPGHGRMSGIGIIEAATAIAAGHCDYAALLYANIGRSRRVNYGGDESPGTWDPWGVTSPGAAHAMAFRRHMEMYGTTTRQLAEVSVAIRYHASLNPGAVALEIGGARYVAPLGPANLGVGAWRLERGPDGWVELRTDDDPPAFAGMLHLASRVTLLRGDVIARERGGAAVLRMED